jgi:hypothetical protein
MPKPPTPPRFEAEALLPRGEFVEPPRMLEQEQWSQMQQARLDWNSVDYFSA